MALDGSGTRRAAMASDGGAEYYWVPVDGDEAYLLAKRAGGGFVDAGSGAPVVAVAASEPQPAPVTKSARATGDIGGTEHLDRLEVFEMDGIGGPMAGDAQNLLQ